MMQDHSYVQLYWCERVYCNQIFYYKLCIILYNKKQNLQKKKEKSCGHLNI